MILFLYGQDTHRLNRKLKEIEQGYRQAHKSALNLEKLDAEQISFQDFCDKLFQQSMFIEKKLFVLFNIFNPQSERFKKYFSKDLSKITGSKNIIVLIEKQSPKKNDRLFQRLLKIAKCQEFAPLQRQELIAWVKKEFAKYSAQIDYFALERLINIINGDFWRLSSEIQKLASYTKNITDKDIDLFLTKSPSADIFKTIDALAGGDKKTALKLLQNHLQKGDSPFYLLTMFAYQFRNLIMVKSRQTENAGSSSYGAACSKNLGLHPFVFRKTSQLAQSFTLDQLKKIFNKIFQTDQAIKTGGVQPEEGLRMLVAGI